MNETLEIVNFAGIHSITLDVKQINILIGEQATGKSICAKLLFYFKSFFEVMLDAAQEGETRTQFDARLRARFLEYFPLESLGSAKFRVRYQLDEYHIEVSRSSRSIRIEYSQSLKNVLNSNRKYYRSHQSEASKLPGLNARMKLYSYVTDSVRDMLGHRAAFKQLFVPAGRSFFALLESNIFSFLSSKNSMDPFLSEFGQFYQSTKGASKALLIGERDRPVIHSQLDTLTQKILSGKHLREDGRDYIMMDDKRKVDIAMSSSGQQEMLPLAVILKFLPFIDTGSMGITVYIEEPEAHLFPTAQRHIVEFIATVFNSSKNGLQFFVTTHSPYMLTAFNNLIEAGALRNSLGKKSLRQLHRIVPSEQILDPSELQAYALANGSAETLMSSQTGLINAEAIDDVSDDLAVQFDKLMAMSEEPN